MADKPSGLKPPSKIAKAKTSGLKPPTAGSTTSGAPSAVGTSFNVGDRVLVSGTKPGTIQFLGPTQFAPGDWAGVVLDKEEGKNDGSVAGVRYFQCEPAHGIFARPAKLSKLGENGTGSRPSSAGSRPGSGNTAVKTTPLTTAALKAREGPSTAKPKPSVRSPASSIRSLRLGTPSRPAPPATQDFELGDKVIVNGVKTGFARFVGETDFAKGTWVGVELISPQGKNDGSVQGKRYFTCEMLFGLFAPLHKVKKLVPSTPRTATASRGLARETAASAAKKRPTNAGIKSPGSSVASVSSVSSYSGVKAKGLKSEVSSRYQRKTAPAGTSALQEALKEKQQHVESLMVERDMERAEMMQASQDAALLKKELDEMRTKYQELAVEKENQLDSLKQLIEKTDLEKVNLTQRLDEQKTKVEDLQFRLEEEAINKDDLESEMKQTRDRIRELEASLTIEKNRSHSLQTDLEDTRAEGVDDKSALDSLYRERDSARAQAQELQAKLTAAEAAIEAQAKASGDIDVFEDRVSELMQELERMKINSEEDAKNIESYKLKLDEVTTEKNSLEALISELKCSQEKVSEERDSMQFLIDELKLTSEENEKALSQAQKQISQLETDKVNLANEKEEILKASGDSSSQLVSLNDKLRVKDKSIEQLNAEIRTIQGSLEELKAANESLSAAKSAMETEIPILNNQLDEALKSKGDLEHRLSSSENKCEDMLKKSEESSSAHQETLNALQNSKLENTALESRLRDLMNNCQQLQETLKKVQEERSESDEEKTKAVAEAQSSLETLQKKFSEVTAEKEYLLKKDGAMQNKLVEVTEQYGSLKTTHEEMKETLSKLQEQSGEETKDLLKQLQEQRETNEKQRAMVTESTKHMNEMLRQKIALEEIDKEHRSKILILEADAANHKDEYSKLEEQHKSLTEVHDKIQAKLQKMEKSIPDIVGERENVLKREFASERQSLQHTIDITTALVEETRKQSESYRQEIDLAKSENVLVQSLKESLETVEKERDRLKLEIRSSKASPMSQSASTEDSGVGSDEELRGQVDFLNSVIVDQQGKISELNEKIQELETMLLSDADVNADQVAVEYEKEHSEHSRAAPRLFCDICDIFDAHDTDECPTQSSMNYDDAGLPPSVHNATKRGEEREYCENCEAFGHRTEDCEEEDEMY